MSMKTSSVQLLNHMKRVNLFNCFVNMLFAIFFCLCSIMNLFGVLKYKKMGEDYLRNSGFPFTIIRYICSLDVPFLLYIVQAGSQILRCYFSNEGLYINAELVG